MHRRLKISKLFRSKLTLHIGSGIFVLQISHINCVNSQLTMTVIVDRIDQKSCFLLHYSESHSYDSISYVLVGHREITGADWKINSRGSEGNKTMHLATGH